MGKRRHAATIDLSRGFAKTAGSRDAHLNQQRVVDGHAIRDLQKFYDLSRGQAIAMINPTRGNTAFSGLRNL